MGLFYSPQYQYLLKGSEGQIVLVEKMQCITEDEIDGWLAQCSIPKAPYERDSSPGYYLQFNAPTTHRRLDAFTRHYYKRIIHGADSLIHMTDWGGYDQSEMIAIKGIRSSYIENRMLIHSPGHIITPKQTKVGISLFSLSASFTWSSYLYSPRGRTTLLNWEGEIFDFWTDQVDAFSEMKSILAEFGLGKPNQER